MISRRLILILTAAWLVTGCEEEQVTPASIDIIAVTPLQSVIPVQASIQFTAAARDVDLNILEGVEFTWVSSHPEAVSVDANGLATGLRMLRDVSITAAAEGVESNEALVHVAGDPAGIIPGADAEAVTVGRTITLSGKVQDSLGTAVPGAAISGWVAGDPTLISTTSEGLISGLSRGITTVKALYGSLESETIPIYVWDTAFSEDFSEVDTTTIQSRYFTGKNGLIWQINHELKTDTSAAGPYTGRPEIVPDGGNPVLRLTQPSTAYFTNRQMLIMTYGSTTYDTEYMWPRGEGMLTQSNFRVRLRMKGIDDPVAGTTSESLVVFTQYFAGAASPYYLVYAPGRNRVSAWFGAALAPGAPIPEWGAMPEITYDQWFNVVVEVFAGVMRTEIFTGAEPTGAWDYTYSIPDWTGTEENIPGFWFGTFLVDEYYADDIVYYTP